MFNEFLSFKDGFYFKNLCICSKNYKEKELNIV